MANQKEVGEHLGLTKQYVSNLVSQGILPKGIGRGGMDMDACRKAYIEYLRQRARLHLKDVPNDINEEKLRLTKNQADHKEIEVAVLSSKLVHSDDVIDTWQNLIANCRSKLLNIPAKVTHQVLGLKSYAEVEDLITTEVHEALNELANTGLPKNSENNLESVDTDVQATKKT